jgi:hypothetical protein
MSAKLVGVGVYKHISGSNAANTVVKSEAGILKKIVINTKVADVVTIHDALTADANKTIASLEANSSGPWEYNLQFRTGLTVATPANIDLTVVYE